jgi:hypothetical protein
MTTGDFRRSLANACRATPSRIRANQELVTIR